MVEEGSMEVQKEHFERENVDFECRNLLSPAFIHMLPHTAPSVVSVISKEKCIPNSSGSMHFS